LIKVVKMGYPTQFRKFLGKKVIVEARKSKKTYVGELVGEDAYYIYLEGVKIVVDGHKSETSELALWKGRIGEVRLAEGDEA